MSTLVLNLTVNDVSIASFLRLSGRSRGRGKCPPRGGYGEEEMSGSWL